MTECICAFLPHRWDCPQSGRPTYEDLKARIRELEAERTAALDVALGERLEQHKLKARLEAVKALCDEAIAGEHADSEATCAVCLAQDVLKAAEGKP